MAIIATDLAGKSKRVILNENIIMLHSNDKIVFDLIDAEFSFSSSLKFIFNEEGTDLTSKIEIKNNELTIFVYNWNDELPIENTTPFQVSTNEGKKIYIKFRTSANIKQHIRNLHVTVWLDI